MSTEMRMVWHWLSMGPYHFARMSALAAIPGVRLTVVESTCTDDHGWSRGQDRHGFDLVTLGSDPLSGAVLRATAGAYAEVLRRVQPDVIVASGYFERYSRRVVFDYARRRPGTLLLVWSESSADDQPRSWWRETAKSWVIRRFDGALVAGTPHLRYMGQLGMPEPRICISGGCVDNDFFAERADRARGCPNLRRELNLPENYFLYVGRFIPKKNLAMLLRAHARYRSSHPRGWDLVLVGNGPDEAALRDQVQSERIPGVVFAGLKQAEELPIYYGLAGCFVLPSTSEPWGLVVNEALASGIPVLASDRSGCAEDLVRQGESGFLFPPDSVSELAYLMGRMSEAHDTAAMGARGREIVQEFSPRRFGERSAAHMRALRAGAAADTRVSSSAA